jgi:putative ATP-binding cassette transporter
MLAPSNIDNPDQRIAEDIRQFIDATLSLTVGLLGEVARLFSFVAILWTLSDVIPLQLFGQSYMIPGYLVWAALIYAVLGTAFTHWIGRPLIPLDFEQERREADFRFALVRLRENAEAVALLRGEAEEKQELLSRFRAITQNWFRLMSRQQWVGLFTGAYRRFSLYFPYFAMAPLYFGGNMLLGAFMQSGSAFNQVRDSFSYFITSYLKIAELSAIVQRLSQFDGVVKVLHGSHAPKPLCGEGTVTICARDLTVTTSDSTPIAKIGDLNLRAGEAVLMTGDSGAGKTSLLRALGGIWPYAAGEMQIAGANSLMLPQRAYIPLGSLRRVLAYPREVSSANDADYKTALTAVGLDTLADHLDSAERRWDKRLSEGEKQRLSIARALLITPELLFLDEATAALDESSEIALHRLIRERLPSTTILAVSHRGALAELYDRTIQIVPPTERIPDER